MTRVFQVDAFTSEPFRGNPAAVCLLDSERDSGWMQAVAAEMNLSETAFLSRGSSGYQLRWFTPTVEVPLCGHATLSTAHILWEIGEVNRSTGIAFQTASGTLDARFCDGWIELDFPEFRSKATELPARIAAAVPCAATDVRIIDERGQPEPTFLLVLPTETAVRDLRPRLQDLRYAGASSIIVTAPTSQGPYDFVSRYFAPGAGIDEDPVTGAAHCCLAPYWAERLGKSELLGYQASTRGGAVGMRLVSGRVVLRGRAVTVLRGELVA